MLLFIPMLLCILQNCLEIMKIIVAKLQKSTEIKGKIGTKWAKQFTNLSIFKYFTDMVKQPAINIQEFIRAANQKIMYVKKVNKGAALSLNILSKW